MSTKLLNRRPYGYLKMEMEDPEEARQRRAQFLIYKTLQRADSIGRPSWLKVKTSKLKIKIGRRLMRLRKTILAAISAAEAGFYKQLISQLKALRRLFRSREDIVALPPLFT